MKYLILSLFLISTTDVTAQQIEVQTGSSPAYHELYEYSLLDARFTIEDQRVRVIRRDSATTIPGLLALDRNDSGDYLQVLYQEGELISELFDERGRSINRLSLENFDVTDETIDVRLFNDGRFVIRDNVANFTFYDTDGSIQYQVSNSTQNPDGESVSELAADPAGRTVVLYNPRINYGTSPGSRARLVWGENEYEELISSRDRAISHLSVSHSGSFILLITERDGAGDQLHIFDRFGNPLTEYELEENLSGADITDDGNHLTIWFGNRVQVYQTADMERVGSVTLQSTIAYATFHPEDSQLVALGGTSGRNRRILNPEIFSVHLEARQIASREVRVPLTYLRPDLIQIERSGPGRYRFNGLNRPVEFQTRF